MVTFKYECLPIFCFLCDLLDHSERFCPKQFNGDENMVRNWDISITVPMGWAAGPPWSRWLRPEGVGGGGDSGEENLVEKDVCVNPDLVKESLVGNHVIEKQLTIGCILNI